MHEASSKVRCRSKSTYAVRWAREHHLPFHRPANEVSKELHESLPVPPHQMLHNTSLQTQNQNEEEGDSIDQFDVSM